IRRKFLLELDDPSADVVYSRVRHSRYHSLDGAGRPMPEHSSSPNKIDPRLRSLVRRTRAAPPARAAAPPERRSVGVKFTGDPNDLKRVGFTFRSVVNHATDGSKLATGTIEID